MKKRNHTTFPEESVWKVEEAAAKYETKLSIRTTVMKVVTENDDHIKQVISLLGLQSFIDYTKIKNNSDFIDCIRLGLPKKALDKMLVVTGFSLTDAAAILNTTDRTLRRYTPQFRLNPEQSERLIELAKLYARGEEVFGSLDLFKTWMASNVIALGNKKPVSYLDTSIGIDILMNELGRIEHGIFA